MLVMRAVGQGASGRLVADDVPAPRAKAGELLVRIASAGVNRADLLQVRGEYPSPPGWPEWPGLECAGTVVGTGEGDASFASARGVPELSYAELISEFTSADAPSPISEGDGVCALTGGGAYAEMIAVPATLALPVPAGLNVVAAGGLMEAACTVWSNLEAAGAAEGETLLVHGGSGGIGTMAIQVGRALGMRVIATARGAERTRKCIELGATAAVDYTTEDFVQATLDLGGADVILDVVGADYLERNLAALNDDGRLVVIGRMRGSEARLDLGLLMRKRARIIGTTLRGRPLEQREAIVSAVGRHLWPQIPLIITPTIHAALPMQEANDAHEMLRSGTAFGKVVLTP